jgi:glyoxylase-like metal-dependent hydrolase (beta-lactamase superfamily II)
MFIRLTKEASRIEGNSLDSVMGFYRFHVGEHEIIVINDGFLGMQVSALAVNAPQEDVLSLIQEYGLGTEFALLSIGVALVRTGDRLVLVDNGVGASDFARNLFGDYIGGLLPTLDLIGVSPEAITDVIFSHSHADHLGGTSSDGQLTFPNAQHYLPLLEWENLHRENIPEVAVPFYEFARSQLQPLVANEGQLTFYGDEDELVPGIRAVATLGHSAGHHSLIIASGDQQLLLLFDVIAHPVLHFRHPEWVMGPDQIPDVAVKTRQQILARVADEKIPVLAHHFPFPGLGHVTRFSDAYRYVPTS